MKILLVVNSKLPVLKYGGTQRVIWYLAKELKQLGHYVALMAYAGTHCDFVDQVLVYDHEKDIALQLQDTYDIIHFHCFPRNPQALNIPYVMTLHGNIFHKAPLDRNTIFISKKHAALYGSSNFVYNGLDFNDYGSPNLKYDNSYFHFLAKARWSVKNLKGAIATIKKVPGGQLKVLGGNRFKSKLGLADLLSTATRFEGKVGGEYKNQLIKNSKGLLFPVIWNEPFGLAIIESLYLGTPVFGTTHGSLPELITEEVGFLSNHLEDLVENMKAVDCFDRKRCHEYAADQFNSRRMALDYLKYYEKCIDQKTLHVQPPVLQGDNNMDLEFVF